MLTVQTLRDAGGPAKQSAPRGRLWVLANHAGLPGLNQRLEREGVPCMSLFGEAPHAPSRQVAPLLWALDDLHDGRTRKCIEWLAEHGSYSGSLLFLWSELPGQELLRRLVRRIDARLADGDAVVLRYFDARVFEALTQVLSTRQQSAWYSPASHWWYVDRAGQLQAWPGSTHPPEADPLTGTLELDDAQFAALLDASEPDQIAELLRAHASQPFLALAPQHRHAFVQRHSLAARGLGLAATRDLATYCALALLHGEDFAAQQPWPQILSRLARREVTLAQAIEQAEAALDEEGNAP